MSINYSSLPGHFQFSVSFHVSKELVAIALTEHFWASGFNENLKKVDATGIIRGKIYDHGVIGLKRIHEAMGLSFVPRYKETYQKAIEWLEKKFPHI